MPRTLAEWLAGAVLRRRLDPRLRLPLPKVLPPLPIDNRRLPMNLTFLDGYKTYIVAAAMLLAGLSQLVGVDLPSFDGQSAGHLVMEAFAIIFLRRGMKATG